MLFPRTETILKSIVEQYITGATPVPSQGIINHYQLGVSAATIRNEMAYLEQEGYAIRLLDLFQILTSEDSYHPESFLL